jgi:hypothetical protein
LFTDSSAEISSLLLPLSLVHFQWSHPFHCVLDYSLLFIIQFFGGQGVSLLRGMYWFIPGVAGEFHMMCGAHLLVCQMSRRQIWSRWWRWQPTIFLSVTWHREAFHGLGVQDVEVLILIGALFPKCGFRIWTRF